MLKECISIFEQYAGEDIDKLVLDNYMLTEGIYVVLRETNDGFEEEAQCNVSFNKRTKELDCSSMSLIPMLNRLDYASSLVDMNKAVDSKKIIQSNNYLSFFIKQESLSNGKLTQEIIDNYYNTLLQSNVKKSKQDKMLYEMTQQEYGAINHEKLNKVRKWIKENVFQLPYEINGGGYLKLFFLCEGIDIKKEGERYLIPKLFNKNDYNIVIDDQIYGFPNENMGLNTKKTYLENKNRKYIVPELLEINKAISRKKFFDYLWGQACKGNYNLYFNESNKKIYAVKPKDSPVEPIQGYYLRIIKGKNEAAILDMDVVLSFHPKLKAAFIYDNHLLLDSKQLEKHRYGKWRYLYEVRDIIHSELFSGYLLNNLYNDPKDISCNNDEILKRLIISTRSILSRWFYRGYANRVGTLLETICMTVIKNSIENSLYMDKVQHQFNLYISLQTYFKGGEEKMSDIMMDIRNSIREKINKSDYVSAGNDNEYYYAAGQLIRYFVSLNKSNNKKHSLFNPFLNLKKDEQLKEKLASLFKKYNYTIDYNSRRFSQMYSLVVNYVPIEELNQNYLIAGYISNNLIYEKKEEEKNE